MTKVLKNINIFMGKLIKIWNIKSDQVTRLCVFQKLFQKELFKNTKNYTKNSNLITRFLVLKVTFYQFFYQLKSVETKNWNFPKNLRIILKW